MSTPPFQITVLGCGIMGLSSALHILETRGDVRVTIIADKFSPETTSDVAAGFWNPYLVGEVTDETLRFWCQETFDYLLNLCLSENAATYGVGLLSAYQLSHKPMVDPPFSDVFLNWRNLSDKELGLFAKKYKYGKFFTTIYAECAKLLPYMLKKFEEKGGKFIRRKIHTFSELVGHCDVLVNCPGLGAVSLLNDSSVRPIRGQTIRVYAPWIKHAIVDDQFHILPNSDVVVCGGTKQIDDWNMSIDPTDRQRIWQGCCKLCPSLKEGKIVREVVGLRPSRFKPRIESEIFKNKIGQILEVIHNYGHGGSGVTLFWGCAKDVAKLVDDSIARVRKERLSAKL